MGQKEPPRLGSTICYGQELSRKSHQDSAVRFVTAKRWPERATKTRQYDLLRPNVGQKEPPRLGSTICYGQTWARKSHQDSAVRFVTAKSWPERATKTRQYDLLRPRVVQKEPPRLGSTICYGQELARKCHQDSAVRFVTAKSWPEQATKTRQHDLLRPNVGQKEPSRLASTICYGQELARKSHQDSAVRFVTAKSWPERASKTRQYELLRPRVGQKEPPRLGNTIYYGQEWARKSYQDSAVRFVTAKRGPERATKTLQYDLLRPTERATETRQYDLLLPKRGPERAQDSAVRFVTAKSWPEKASKTRQYDLLRPRVGQKEPPRLGSTTCYGEELARKSHRRFVTAKSGPRVGQQEPPRLGGAVCYGQELARRSHQDSAVRSRKSNQDSAVRFVTAKSWPERATKTRQYDLLRRKVNQKEPPRPASTIRYGQKWARKNHQDSAVRFVTAKRGPIVGQNNSAVRFVTAKSGPARKRHQDSAVRFVTAKRGPERTNKTRQYDLLRPRLGQKEPPRLGSTICYGQELARKSHRDSAVRYVTAKSWPEGATRTRQYDLLPPRVGQKEPPRLGSTICYGQTWARKSHQSSAVRFVTAKRGPERATKTRQYDLLRPNVGQKEPPRLGSTICYGQELSRKSHQGSAVRFVTAKRGSERATKTRQYDLLWPNVGQKEPPRLGSTICYGQELARKATKTRQYDLLRPNVGQKEPPRLGSTRFVTAKRGPERTTKTRQYDLVRPTERATETRQYDLLRPTWARKSHQDSAVRCVTAKSWLERATKTRQYDLLRPRLGQKKPPRLGSTICYGQTWARKSHQDSAVRFVTAKSWPEKATKTRQYDLLRPRVGQKCHQDSAVRLVTAKRGPERATKTRQYDLLRPRVGQKKPPRLGSTICYGQTWARKNHQDSAVRFVTAKRGPERATETRQYDLLRPNVGQKEPPRLGSTICYGQTWARKSHQDSAVRFVTAKSGPEKTTKTRQYDLLRPTVGQKKPPRLGSTICYCQQKEPPRLGSTICYCQRWARKNHQDSAVRLVTAKSWPEYATKTAKRGPEEAPRLGSTICYGQELARKSHLGSAICYGQELARKSHQDSAVRFVTAKSWPENATKTRQYDLLRPNVGQKEPPRLGSTICYGQELDRKSYQDSAVRFVTAKSWPENATNLGRNKSYCRVLVALSGQLLTVTNRTAEVALSGQLLAVTNRTAESCGSSGPRLAVLVAYSGQLLAVTSRTAESWWLFLAHLWQ